MTPEEKRLRDKMYEDLVELGIIDEKEEVKDHTPETLWNIMIAFHKAGEVF